MYNKKNSNSMKIKHFGFAVAAVALLASCSDDDIVANVQLPEEIEQSMAEGLENHSYSIPFEVKSDAEWKIEFDEAGDEIAYAHPAKGKGNATVNLYVMDNLTTASRQGNMTIVFPEDESKNKVVPLKQKAKDGSDDNFSTDAVGNITYGVGYGFNAVTGVGARAIKSQVIKAQLLTEGNYVQKAPTSSTSIDFQTHTGSTVKELSNNFSASTEFSGGGWGIEAEANAKFDMNNYSKDEFQYAMSFVDVAKEQITVTLHQDEWPYWEDHEEGCFTRAAYNAINGIHSKYPTDNEGFKRLFDNFGTHVIRTATLGGRLTIATTINTSEITTEYDLEAFAKMSYSGIVDVSGEVNDTYKNSFNENSSACQTKISALGGSSAIFSDLSDLVGDGAKNAANAWFESMNENEATWTFIGLDNKDDLIPIWDLVEDAERADMMKDYFESGQYAEDVTHGVIYDLGVQAHLVDGAPNFEITGTQIADVKIGQNNNKTVARICNEFIPELDETAPVKVVYPVINGKVKWNMGWFVGNEYFPPRRIVNVNGNIKVEAIRNEDQTGEANEVYIRGVRIASTPVDEETVAENAISTPYYELLMRDYSLSNYKVVKILDNIWLGENYAALKNVDGSDLYVDSSTGWGSHPVVGTPGQEGYNNWYYYDYKLLYQWNPLPEGWHMSVNHEYVERILNMLKPYNIKPAEAFCHGGCLRFNAIPTGYMQLRCDNNPVHKDPDNFYMAVDGSGDYRARAAFVLNFAAGTAKSREILISNDPYIEDQTKIKQPIMLPYRLHKSIR